LVGSFPIDVADAPLPVLTGALVIFGSPACLRLFRADLADEADHYPVPLLDLALVVAERGVVVVARVVRSGAGKLMRLSTMILNVPAQEVRGRFAMPTPLQTDNPAATGARWVLLGGDTDRHYATYADTPPRWLHAGTASTDIGRHHAISEPVGS
jgi:hypothetical protein